ncbi:hypothetical protein COY95_03860, partial [Candidatus Woesearchaeota archaeon CG_4_10_14_0_8_um_filter_47_5]
MDDLHGSSYDSSHGSLHDSLPWVRKYNPLTTEDLIGQEEPVAALRNFTRTFSSQNTRGKKAVILYGPPGCGKTAAAHALAHEDSCEIMELNASDFRNREHIESIVGTASKQA